MPTAGQHEPAANNVVDQLEFERLLSEISSRFVNLTPDDVDREIGDGLRRVCEHLDIDFAALWQWSDASRDLAMATHIRAFEGCVSASATSWIS